VRARRKKPCGAERRLEACRIGNGPELEVSPGSELKVPVAEVPRGVGERGPLVGPQQSTRHANPGKRAVRGVVHREHTGAGVDAITLRCWSGGHDRRS
jgi:hypothetical protein